jgi:hypothetical protein
VVDIPQGYIYLFLRVLAVVPKSIPVFHVPYFVMRGKRIAVIFPDFQKCLFFVPCDMIVIYAFFLLALLFPFGAPPPPMEPP